MSVWALGSLIQYWILQLAALPVAGGLELYDPCGPVQPKLFYGSMVLWLRCEGIDQYWNHIIIPLNACFYFDIESSA